MKESNLRKKQEILTEYTQHAALLGDRVFRQGMLQAEVNQLHQKMCDLNNEQSEESAKLGAVPTLVPDAVLPPSA